MELEELLAWSDIVSVHSPLNERTRGLIGLEQLKKMKPSAIIINVARGGIIDEAALAEALDSGYISAAALDVFSVEPLRESPLYNIKDRYRLLASPHNAWSAAEAIDNLIDCIAKNIENWLKRE
jgi:glycerate dehydrogenase